MDAEIRTSAPTTGAHETTPHETTPNDRHPRSEPQQDRHEEIRGALGSVRQDEAPRRGLLARLRTLVAVVGPGLIVMVGDNDAGAFGTYTQAGQNYGTRLLWTLLLLVPVLFVNQEMVLRLGAVTGVGHARLIRARFGRFWGAFSVANLTALNALTMITEFVGISMGLEHLGVPRLPGVLVAAAVIAGAASTGSFRRFERLCLVLVAGTLLLVPLLLLAHPPLAQLGHDFAVPGLPASSDTSGVLLLVVAIVGTTVAPWQLFFQQSYIVDKRITTRFIRYEKVDLWLGIAVAVLGAAAMMAFTATAFSGTRGAGNFTDAAGVAGGLGANVSHLAGVLFAIALVDASVIGAAAVSLSTAYAVGDLFGGRHSLHRSFRDAKGFHATLAALLVVSAVVVVVPASPLGLITEGVQTLAGVLLPSASAFLLLLCNDRDLLGPWANGRLYNALATAVLTGLVMLSVVMAASVVQPDISADEILDVLETGAGLALLAGLLPLALQRPTPKDRTRGEWRAPALDQLPPPRMGPVRRLGLVALSGYLAVAVVVVLVRLAQLALS